MMEYYDFLEVLKNQEETRRFLANMSNRHWAATVQAVLAKLSSHEALHDIKIDIARVDSDDAQNTIQNYSNLFFDLIVRTAAHRAWSCLTVSDVAPEQWNGVLSSIPAESQHAFKIMKADAEVVAQARTSLAAGGHPEQKAGQSKHETWLLTEINFFQNNVQATPRVFNPHLLNFGSTS